MMETYLLQMLLKLLAVGIAILFVLLLEVGVVICTSLYHKNYFFRLVWMLILNETWLTYAIVNKKRKCKVDVFHIWFYFLSVMMVSNLEACFIYIFVVFCPLWSCVTRKNVSTWFKLELNWTALIEPLSQNWAQLFSYCLIRITNKYVS